MAAPARVLSKILKQLVVNHEQAVKNGKKIDKIVAALKGPKAPKAPKAKKAKNRNEPEWAELPAAG